MVVNICDVCGKRSPVCSGGKITVTDYAKMKAGNVLTSMTQLDVCEDCLGKINRMIDSMESKPVFKEVQENEKTNSSNGSIPGYPVGSDMSFF